MSSEFESTIRYFGDYFLLGRVGEGGMGEVWCARQETLNRKVALKLIRAEKLSARTRHLFLAEAEAVARLNHDHIVRIHEVGEHEGRHYFSMEWFEEGSLAEHIAAGRWLMNVANASQLQRAAARLMAQLARAVHHAHQRMVIHRDIKPGNILLDEEGGPHLSDFGIAKILGDAPDAALTRGGIGTLGYTAPEQARSGRNLVTNAVDVYSMGAVLYELLTGRRLPDNFETPQQILHDEPLPPSRFQPLVERDLEIICLKCLQYEPELRYESAHALANDLQRWLNGEPIEAHPATAREKLVKWCRRHPAVAALAALLTVSVLGGLAATTWQWRRAEAERVRVVAANDRLELQRAEILFETGNPRRAVASLGAALRANPRNRAALERLVNELNDCSFLIRSFNSGSNPSSANRLETSLRVARNPAGRANGLIATATNQAADDITLWDQNTGVRVHSWPALHTNAIRSIAWDTAGQRLVSASSDSKIIVWSTNSGRPAVTFEDTAPVHHATFSSDGRFIVTAGRNQMALVWSPETPLTAVHPPMAHSAPVNTARFSPDNASVVTTCDDQSVRLWNPITGEQKAEASRFTRQPVDAWFDGRADSILVRLEDGAIVRMTCTRTSPRKVDSAENSVNQRPRLPVAIPGLPAGLHSEDIVCTNWSFDGRLLATASVDKTARVWDGRTFTPVTERLVHEEVVNTVAFSPEGRRLATLTPSFHRIWDVETGQPLSGRRYRFGDRGLFHLEFRENGKSTWTSDGASWSVHVADGPAPDWLIRLAELIAQDALTTVQWPTLDAEVALQSEILAALQHQPQTDRLAEWACQWLGLHANP